MKKKEAKAILKHIKKDSKEFKHQLHEDKELAKKIKKSASTKKGKK